MGRFGYLDLSYNTNLLSTLFFHIILIACRVIPDPFGGNPRGLLSADEDTCFSTVSSLNVILVLTSFRFCLSVLVRFVHELSGALGHCGVFIGERATNLKQ